MKKIIFIIIIAGLGIYFTLSYLGSNKVEDSEHNHTTDTSVPKDMNKKEGTKTSPPSTTTLPPSAAKKAIVDAHQDHGHGQSDEGFEVPEVEVPNDEEGASLIELSEVAAKFATANVNVEALKDSLTKSGLDVVSTKDSNPYTGSMTVIRTNNSLPGTRYFHAQVFANEDGSDPYVQHMSYEYRASENAFAEAVAATKKTFGLKQANVRNDGFYSWNTDDGYVISVKRQEKEDLQNDAFNAYTDADVGTIRVRKELEIH